MTNRTLPLFHHAFPVSDIAAARAFYGDLLGCPVARKGDNDAAIDFDFFGHHIVMHLVAGSQAELHRQAASGESLAVRHFGVVLAWDDWHALAARLHAAGAAFDVAPLVIREGEPGEEAYMMLSDPAGNGVEFKTFRDLDALFVGP